MHNKHPDRPIMLSVFKGRFVAHIVNCHPVDQVAYGKRVGEYATGVAAAYWDASQEDGWSPEQCAADDMSYWAADHASPALTVIGRSAGRGGA